MMFEALVKGRRDYGRGSTAFPRPWACWVLYMVVAACASRSPSPATSKDRREDVAASIGAASTNASVPALPATPSIPPCEKAAQQRARVAGLLAEGKLHRTLRVIDHANQLCPATVTETWIPEVETLAEIGRYKAARDLAAKILANPPSPDARSAAEHASKLVKERDLAMPDTNEAKAPMRTMWRKAEVAADAKKYSEASRLFVNAWTLWHPNNGRALAAAGHFAKLAGDAPGAQRLFDRATEELEQQYDTATKVELPSGLSTVSAVAWSPTQQAVAVTDGDEVVLVDAITAREIRRMRGHESAVTSLAFSRDGQSLVSSSADNTVRLWRVSDGNELRSFEALALEHLSSVALSPDNKYVAAGSGEYGVRLWQISDGSLLAMLSVQGDRESHSTTVAFSPDSRFLAAGFDDNMIRLWRIPNGALVRTFKGHRSTVTSVAFSPDGRSLASGSLDETVRLWGVVDGAVVRSFERRSNRQKTATSSRNDLAGTFQLVFDRPRLCVHSVAYSPKGDYVVSGYEDSTIHLWRVSDGMEQGSFSGHKGSISSVAFSKDGTTIVSSASDHTVRLWRAQDGALIGSITARKDSLTSPISVTFSANGNFLTSGSHDGAVRVWRVSDGTLRASLKGDGDSVTSVAIDRSGSIVASSSNDRTVRIWRLPSGALQTTLAGHGGSIAISPDGHLLASGSNDNILKIWRVSDGALLRTFEGHEGEVTSVAFSPDGKTIASGSADSTAKTWRLSDGALLQSLEHPGSLYSVAFSPDGASLASGCDYGVVKLWELSDGSLRNETYLEGRGAVTSVAFSPDGHFLAIGHCERTVGLWPVESLHVSHLLEHNDTVSSVAFSPDGTRLVTAGSDGLRLWRTEDHSLVLHLISQERHDAQVTVAANSQYFDVTGEDAKWAIDDALICRIGPIALAAELCTERAYVPGLWVKLMSNDPEAIAP